VKQGQTVVLLGAGGHAAVVAEAILLLGGKLGGYVSPTAALGDGGGLKCPYLGDDEALNALVAADFAIALALGFVDAAGAARRARILNTLAAGALATIIHPAATVSHTAKLGAGCFAAAGAIIGTRSYVGIGSIVNTGAVVDHDCRIGTNSHIATGAVVAGGVSIGADVLIGAGATVLQGVNVGDAAVVGAGAVVVADVDARTTVVGVPARPIFRELS
jgi:sugar O-acyltransferase (sialic acid O-acetyltransferase NeuD family)